MGPKRQPKTKLHFYISRHRQVYLAFDPFPVDRPQMKLKMSLLLSVTHLHRPFVISISLNRMNTYSGFIGKLRPQPFHLHLKKKTNNLRIEGRRPSTDPVIDLLVAVGTE